MDRSELSKMKIIVDLGSGPTRDYWLYPGEKAIVYHVDKQMQEKEAFRDEDGALHMPMKEDVVDFMWKVDASRNEVEVYMRRLLIDMMETEEDWQRKIEELEEAMDGVKHITIVEPWSEALKKMLNEMVRGFGYGIEEIDVENIDDNEVEYRIELEV